MFVHREIDQPLLNSSSVNVVPDVDMSKKINLNNIISKILVFKLFCSSELLCPDLVFSAGASQLISSFVLLLNRSAAFILFFPALVHTVSSKLVSFLAGIFFDFSSSNPLRYLWYLTACDPVHWKNLAPVIISLLFLITSILAQLSLDHYT
ncbi:hypothetical protein F511_42634 [Dorcoceras hygrometricum]|uniref:Uncharacterized protein n=1 Tax=Dorcoceras hygrometricum TaxID=472368 RepID=A0A2Z7D6P9_9LAMI|nr:hypothetical protein F511_42634 [Dorcoceras hygrometricum]